MLLKDLFRHKRKTSLVFLVPAAVGISTAWRNLLLCSHSNSTQCSSFNQSQQTTEIEKASSTKSSRSQPVTYFHHLT